MSLLCVKQMQNAKLAEDNGVIFLKNEVGLEKSLLRDDKESKAGKKWRLCINLPLQTEGVRM